MEVGGPNSVRLSDVSAEMNRPVPTVATVLFDWSSPLMQLPAQVAG
jgi:hypothetical protein